MSDVPGHAKSEGERFQLLLEQADIALFYVRSPDHLLTYVSPQSRRFLGIDAGGLPMKWTDLLTDHPVNAEGLALAQRALETREAQAPYLLELGGAHGAKRWVEVHESPVVEAGRVVIVVGALVDVSERRLAEARLRESEMRLAEAQRIAHLGSWHWDIAADAVMVSDELQRILGVAAAAFPAPLEGFLLLVHPDDRERTRSLIAQAYQERRAVDWELRVDRPDGRRVTLHASTDVICDAAGMPAQMIGAALDITERKQVEAALRTSEQRYRILAEAAHDLIYIIGRNGEVQYVNHFAAGYFDARPEQLVGRPYQALFPRDQADPQWRSLERVFKTGQPVYAEDKTTFPQGDFWLGTWLVPIRDERGQNTAVLCSSRDITERKRSEQALRLQSTALDAAANGIVITDRAGRVVWANPAFTRLTGYAPEEILGQNLRLLKSDQHDPAFYERLWSAIVRGDVWQGEVTNRRKDGQLYRQELTVTPVRNDRGDVTHFVAIQQDVTLRQQMEMELRQSRQRFEGIFRSNPAAIGISALSDGRFLEVNDSLLRLLEYTREEMVGATAAELGLWADAGAPARLGALVQAQNSVFNAEVRVRAKTGKVRDALVSIERIQLGLEPCQVFLMVDITERKALEEQLRQSQKMKSIGTLAGGIAHDFNNLLTVIQGHACLLPDEKNLSPQALDSVRQIIEAAERATNLTRQLLAFSRRQVMRAVTVNLNEIVGNMTRMLHRIIGEDIKLLFHYAPLLPPLQADPGMMEQVVLNLAVNSRDAMPKGGELVITTSTRTVDDAEARRYPEAVAGGVVCLTVQDTGCGIPSDVLPHIFEPFFTTKDLGQGTGLGLATVYGIVKQHQGWLQVSSEVGRGTIFQVLLPSRPDAEIPAPDKPASQPIRGGHETILLVEDDLSVRRLARKFLERAGYRVLEAASGVEAWSVWETQADTIDLLLTDMVMPDGMSGRELAERLRSQRPGLKVIFASGYSQETQRSDFVLGPGQFFLPKPYALAVLAQTLRDCLDPPVA